VRKNQLKNSHPFGKKMSENRRGDFLTHTVERKYEVTCDLSNGVIK